MKPQTRAEVLLKLAKEIHNPNVIAAYGGDVADDMAFLLKTSKIEDEDGFTEVILKMLIFYMGAGRVNAIAPIPTFWAAKAERFRPQLAIVTRPVNRKKLAYSRYQGNGLLHIPHYDVKVREPKIPAYTVGAFTCKYKLKDGSSILIHASSEAEALTMVKAMARYVKASQKPAGGVEVNCSYTKRGGKPLLLDGVQMKPFRAAYYDRADRSQTPVFTVNL
jgi:hypothetical protein